MKKAIVFIFALMMTMAVLMGCGASQNEDYLVADCISTEPKLPEGLELIQKTGYEEYCVVYDNESGLYGIYDCDSESYVDDNRYEEISRFYGEEENEFDIVYAKLDDYYGYINQQGIPITSFQFTEADAFYYADTVGSSGRAIVKIKYYGVIDTDGNFVIEPSYTDKFEIYDSDDGSSFYFVSKKLSEKNAIRDIYPSQLLDLDGNLLIDGKYADFVLEDHYIYALFFEKYNSESWYALFDYSGTNLLENLSIPLDLEYPREAMCISLPQNGVHRLLVTSHTSKETMLFDENLQMISSERFSYISPFSVDGIAAAFMTVEQETGDWFAIDKNGNHIETLPSTGGYSGVYTYVDNNWIVYEEENLINRNDGTEIEGERVVIIDETHAIAIQDEDTELWSFYDGNDLIDSNCTNIGWSKYEDYFDISLYHGETYKDYKVSRG